MARHQKPAKRKRHVHIPRNVVEKIRKLPLLSNFLFEALMMYDMELTRLILKVLLGYDPGPLESATIEKDIQPVMDRRGIRTDVYIVAHDGTVYDIEAQQYSVQYLDKRIALYRSFMIVCNTKTGSDYADVPSTATVFICTEDPVGKGLARYITREQVFREKNGEMIPIDWNEDQKTIMFYVDGDMLDLTEDQRNLLQYLKTGIPCDPLTERMEQVVRIIKSSEEFQLSYWRQQFDKADYGRMCREEGEKTGIIKGERTGMLSTLANLVNSEKLNIKDAADNAGMSVDEFRKAAKDYLQ